MIFDEKNRSCDVMPNQYRTFRKYRILIVMLLLMICMVNGENNPDLSKNMKLYQIFKRDLLSKEREYLKSNPISSELRSFIDRLKRRVKNGQKRDADKLDKEHMYVVKDGEIIPFNEIENFSNEILSKADNDQKFTVLPLIVPITVSKEIKPKCDENSSDTEQRTPNQTEKKNEMSTTISTTARTSTGTTTLTTTTFSNDNDEITSTTGHTVNSKLLHQIFNDIKELVNDKEAPTQNLSVACKVTGGDWDSTAGGMQIRIEALYDSKYPEVHLVAREPPADEGFLKEGNWTLSAFVPYSRSPSILVLNAYSITGIKLVATFIGECRVCESLEAITGHWLIQRQSKDCSDREVSHRFISDVLKKNNVRKLQQQHLNSLATIPTMPV